MYQIKLLASFHLQSLGRHKHEEIQNRKATCLQGGQLKGIQRAQSVGLCDVFSVVKGNKSQMCGSISRLQEFTGDRMSESKRKALKIQQSEKNLLKQLSVEEITIAKCTRNILGHATQKVRFMLFIGSVFKSYDSFLQEERLQG